MADFSVYSTVNTRYDIPNKYLKRRAERLRCIGSPDKHTPETMWPWKKESLMALRARKPEAVTKRLKLFMFGPAGVGKTTAAIQFPNSYVIDCEKGVENYDRLVTD